MVDIMTFRGGYERDIKEFVEKTPALKSAVEAEDDDAIETILNERFYHRPEMYYSPDKLIVSYGVPATTPAFVYNALGRKPLPTREAIITDTVDSIAARFNLRYSEQKWVDATAQLLAEDPAALRRFMTGDMTLFTASQFNQLGGISALARFEGAIRSSRPCANPRLSGKVCWADRNYYLALLNDWQTRMGFAADSCGKSTKIVSAFTNPVVFYSRRKTTKREGIRPGSSMTYKTVVIQKAESNHES
jgi:hypothetical protein